MRTILVVKYDPTWPTLFEQEKQQLANLLAIFNPIIHHIGSTSVNGMAAKPTIDILIEVDSVKAIESSALNSLGYTGKGEFGIQGRRYFQKGEQDRSHHVHIYQKQDAQVKRHVAFRDYLSAHPHIADQYAQLKIKGAQFCNNNSEIYCAYKNDFIQQHEKLALQWYR